MPWPWTRPKDAALVSLFMGSAEFLRSGFFVGFLPLYALEVLKIPLSYVGLLTTLHYGAEAFPRVAVVWLANRFPLGWGIAASALVAFFSFHLFLISPTPLFPVWAVLWGLAMSPLWPRIAAFLRQLARPMYQGRAVTYGWLIIGPLIGAGSFGVGFLSKYELELGRLALTIGSFLLLFFGFLLINFRFPQSELRRQSADYKKFLPLLIPAFLQALAPHLLTTVLFPFLKKENLGLAELALPLALAGLLFLVTFRTAARYADQRDPVLVVVLAALAAMVGFGAIGFFPAKTASLISIPTLGAALGLFTPGWNAVVVRALPEGERGEGWAALSTASGTAFALGPFIGALAWDLLGPQGPFRLGLFLLFLLILYYQLYFRRLVLSG